MQTQVHDKKWGRAQICRRLDLLNIRSDAIREWLVNLGMSDKGTREEIIERLHKEIWTKKYD
jgi:hypothetical protein